MMSIGSLPRNTRTRANLWRVKGLSVRASNCLAKAGILNEKTLIRRLTRFEEALILRNCGRLTAREIWTFVTNLKALSPPTKTSLSYDNSSNRVKNVFGKKEVKEEPRKKGLRKQFQGSEYGKPLSDKPLKTNRREMIRRPDNEDVGISSILRETLPQVFELNSEEVEDFIDRSGNLTWSELALNEKDWEVLGYRGFFPDSSLDSIAFMSVGVLLRDLPSEQCFDTVCALALRLAGRASMPAQETLSGMTSPVLSGCNIEHLSILPAFALGAPDWIGQLAQELDATSWGQLTKLTERDMIQRHGFNRAAFQKIHGLWDIRPWAKRVVQQWSGNTAAFRPNLNSFEALVQGYVEASLRLRKTKNRDAEIVLQRIGMIGDRMTLDEIAVKHNLSRERVRQICEGSKHCLRHISRRRTIRPIRAIVLKILREHDGSMSLTSLYSQMRNYLNWNSDANLPALSFFLSVCLGFQVNTKQRIVSDPKLKSEHKDQGFFVDFVKKLQRYGYRPLTSDECMQLYHATSDQLINPNQLLNSIANHPDLKVYEYGETYIGLREWTWFNPQKTSSVNGQADLVEWFLRMTNEPATAEAIAYGMWDKLSNFRLDPFEVVGVCENHAYRFTVDENGFYSLYLWEDAPEYKQALENLLKGRSLHVEQIVRQLSSDRSDEAHRIVSALNFHKDTFVETAPFKWALKAHEDTVEGFDHTTLGFEQLIPK